MGDLNDEGVVPLYTPQEAASEAEKLEEQEELAEQNLDDELILIEGDPTIPIPDKPGAQFAQAIAEFSAGLFTHLSYTLAEHRRHLPPEWWSYFPIIGAVALKSYGAVFERDVHESFQELVDAMAEKLTSRAVDGLADRREVD